MKYRDYEDFVNHRTRMSHVYQTVMLMTLLQNDGKESATEIAKATLNHDESEIEYYEKIVGNMLGRVLAIPKGHISEMFSNLAVRRRTPTTNF